MYRKVYTHHPLMHCSKYVRQPPPMRYTKEWHGAAISKSGPTATIILHAQWCFSVKIKFVLQSKTIYSTLQRVFKVVVSRL